MDIDLANDLRRDDDDESDTEEASDVKKQKKRKTSADDDAEQQEDEKDEEDDVKKVMKKANEVAKKKVAKKPRPKLDVDRYAHIVDALNFVSDHLVRLTGPRGLHELCNLFKTEKFKGKGHEVSDRRTNSFT